MLVGRIARLLNGKVTQLKVNYLALGASVTAFALLAILLQTSNGLASNGSLPSEDQLAVASGRCVYPVIPKDTSHLSAAQRAALRAQLLATSADVKPINPVAPDVTGATYPPNVSAVVLVTVAANGEPVSAKVSKSSGNAGFDRATVKAALASTYSPAMSNCKAITGQYLFRADTGPN